MKFLFFKGFYAGMKKFGSNIVNIINFVLLIPVYIIGIGLSAIIAKIMGKKFLNMKKFDKKIKTYWLDKEKKKSNLEDSYKQF